MPDDGLSIGTTPDGAPFVLPLAVVTEKLAFFAQSGAGKSYGAMKLAELMLGVGAQVVVLDPVGIWWGLRVAADGIGPGMAIPVFGGEHGDIPLTPHSGAMVADLIVDHQISAVLDIAEFELPDHKRFVRDFAERFFQRKKGARSPVHLVLEEAQVIAPLNPDRDETTMLNRVERLCRIGRNYGVGWSIISQRPQDVHTKVRNQAGTLFSLRTIGTHERKAIAEWVADKARTQGEARVIDQLPELETGVAQVWSPSFLRIANTVKIAKRQTFDSSATPTFGTETMIVERLAPVDVQLLRDAMQAAYVETEQHDPKLAQQRIAELQRELKERDQHIAQQRARIEALEQQAVEQIEVPVFDDAQAEQLEGAIARLGAAGSEVVQAMQELAARMPASETRRTRPSPVRAVEPPKPLPEATKPAAQRSVPKQRILNALLAFHNVGLQQVARSNVAVWADQSPKSSGFTNNLGSLRTAGLIEYPQPSMLALTAEGRRSATLDNPIHNLRELHRAWMAKLPTSQARILTVVLNWNRHAIDRETLADQAGVSASSSGFTNNLGALRSLGLIDYPKAGYVVATNLLYPKGLEE